MPITQTADTNLLGLTTPQDNSSDYFNMGSKFVQNKQQAIVNTDKLQDEENELNVAKTVFANGIDENSINEFGKQTGNVKKAQEMLKSFVEKKKTDTEITKNLYEQAQKQNELVNWSYDSVARQINGMNFADQTPEGLQKLNSQWAVLKNTASHYADFDDKRNLKYGFQIPDAPDPNYASALLNRGVSVTEQNKKEQDKIDAFWKQKEFGQKEKEIGLREREFDQKASQFNEKMAFDYASLDARTTQNSLIAERMSKKGQYNDTQLKAANSAVAMSEALNTMDKLANKGSFDPTTVKSSIFTMLRKHKKLYLKDIISKFSTEDEQLYANSVINFLVPKLRMDSGAAINSDEYVTEFERYFPLTGASKNTMLQTEKNRRIALNNNISTAGEAYIDMIKTNLEDPKMRSVLEKTGDLEFYQNQLPKNDNLLTPEQIDEQLKSLLGD